MNRLADLLMCLSTSIGASASASAVDYADKANWLCLRR